MKFIMMSPALKRFYWEQVTTCNNLINLGVSPQDIIVVYTDKGNDYPQRLSSLYGVQTYSYPDNRVQEAKQYIPSIKPYLWVQLLKNHPEKANDDYLIIDSDVIFREIPNFNNTPATANTWYGADTEGYTGPIYMKEKGVDFIPRIAPILGISEEEIMSYKGQSVGAQWVISKPQLAYWEDVYETSYKLYHKTVAMEPEYLQRYKNEGRPDFYFYQTWVAEMTATLYLTKKYGINPVITDELDFDWSSDQVAYTQSKHRKLIHNAGITEDMAQKEHLFFKGNYVNKMPFEEDLSWVNPKFVSREYVNAIQKVSKY